MREKLRRLQGTRSRLEVEALEVSSRVYEWCRCTGRAKGKRTLEALQTRDIARQGFQFELTYAGHKGHSS